MAQRGMLRRGMKAESRKHRVNNVCIDPGDEIHDSASQVRSRLQALQSLNKSTKSTKASKLESLESNDGDEYQPESVDGRASKVGFPGLRRSEEARMSHHSDSDSCVESTYGCVDSDMSGSSDSDNDSDDDGLAEQSIQAMQQFGMSGVSPRFSVDHIEAKFTGICRTEIAAWKRGDSFARPMLKFLQPAGCESQATTPLCGELRQKYTALLDERLDKFLDYWLQENLGYGILADVNDTVTVATALCTILTTMNDSIREALLAGDLPRRYRKKENKKLIKALRNNHAQAEDPEIRQPCIYGNYLVNDVSGKGPTYSELRTLLDDYRKYHNDAAFANEVDSAFTTKKVSESESSLGYRKFFCSGGTKSSSKRTLILNQFCEALERRINHELSADASLLHTPMPEPLCEFGFTVKAKQRKEQHALHRNSNFLMNLTETLMKLRYGESAYRIKSFTIYCIPLPMFSPLAEAFLTVLGQGYVANGGGFSHEPAGRSTAGEATVTADQAQNHLEWALNNVDVRRNFRRLTRGLKNDIKRLMCESSEMEVRIQRHSDNQRALEEKSKTVQELLSATPAQLSALEEMKQLKTHFDEFSERVNALLAKEESEMVSKE